MRDVCFRDERKQDALLVAKFVEKMPIGEAPRTKVRELADEQGSVGIRQFQRIRKIRLYDEQPRWEHVMAF